MSPALAGGFSSAAPPGKPRNALLLIATVITHLPVRVGLTLEGTPRVGFLLLCLLGTVAVPCTPLDTGAHAGASSLAVLSGGGGAGELTGAGQGRQGGQECSASLGPPAVLSGCPRLEFANRVSLSSCLHIACRSRTRWPIRAVGGRDRVLVPSTHSPQPPLVPPSPWPIGWREPPALCCLGHCHPPCNCKPGTEHLLLPDRSS